MSRVRDASEQARQIADEATKDLKTLFGHVDRSREPAVVAAKCADVIAKLRADLANIEERFRALEHGSGDDADVE